MFIDIVGGSIGVDFIGVSISVEQMVSDTDVIDKPAMQTISPVLTVYTNETLCLIHQFLLCLLKTCFDSQLVL